jgi:succinate dehydrogenase / fumarate reductase, cytochrome b subunit
MNVVDNQPSPTKFIKWFSPRSWSIENLAFILNRVTGLGLTIYLFIHLAVLGQLARGPEAYNGFVELMHNPFVVFGEVLVVAAGFIHGLNGLRIALNSFGIGLTRQRAMLIGLMSIAIIASLYFAVRMYSVALQH